MPRFEVEQHEQSYLIRDRIPDELVAVFSSENQAQNCAGYLNVRTADEIIRFPTTYDPRALVNRWLSQKEKPRRQARPFSPRSVRKFWDSVDKTYAHCWIWKGSQTTSGYPQFFVDGIHMPAHLYAYRLAHGAIPTGFRIVRTCGMRLCVNPHHLVALRADGNHAFVNAR